MNGRRQRRLTNDEYVQLGRTLKVPEVWKPAIAAAWLMILRDVDAAKCWACGGQRLIYRDELHDWRIPRSAHRSVPWRTTPAWRSDPADEWRSDLCQSIWQADNRLQKDADRQTGDRPPDITPHVLRHSFATLAAALGYSEPTIASLIGHKTHTP